LDSVILAIRLRQLGDVLATLGALKALKNTDPSRSILYMIDECYHDLLRNEAYIDELIPSPPKIGGFGDVLRYVSFIRGLRRRHISVVLDFHSNPRSALTAFLTGAPRRFGYDVKVRKVLYTQVKPRAEWVQGERLPQTASQSAHGLARMIGPMIEEDESLCRLAVSDGNIDAARRMLGGTKVRPGAIGINPGNPYQSKQWPDEYFIDLSRRLVENKRQVLVMWGPGERERAERIRTRSGAGTFLLPELKLAALPGVLRELSLLVSIDSGLKHLAVAVGVPTVTLFGPTSPVEWHMGTVNDCYISLGLSCSPCRLLECPFGTPCMKGITVDMVMKCIESLEHAQP
jgi:ADP-heptose:LPS heptosyltransferase